MIGHIPNRDSDGNAVLHQNAFASNKLADGRVLYLKVHGMKAVVPGNGQHAFQFTIPYTTVFLQGAEVYVDVLAQCDLSVDHPIQGVVEQYGYDVVMGKYIYKEKANYVSELPAGMIISVTVKNTEPVEQEYGVNFILHDVRQPE